MVVVVLVVANRKEQTSVFAELSHLPVMIFFYCFQL